MPYRYEAATQLADVAARHSYCAGATSTALRIAQTAVSLSPSLMVGGITCGAVALAIGALRTSARGERPGRDAPDRV